MDILPLDGRSREQKIKEAIELLLEENYRVMGPLMVKSRVKGPMQLVRFFYDTMAYHNPGHTVGFSGALKRDLGIAERFITAREQTGISRKRALFECCELIETLFKHQDRLNLKVTSMTVLGQEKLAWVMEVVVAVYNGLNNAINQELDQLRHERIYKEQEANHREAEVIEATIKLDEILDNYGTEKEKE